MTIYWDDELEDGNSGYQAAFDSSPLIYYDDTTNKVSGSASMTVDFAGSGVQQYDRTFGAAPQKLWGRVYTRLSVGWATIADNQTKIMLWRTNWGAGHSVSCWWSMAFGGTDLRAYLQEYPAPDSTEVFFCNLGTAAQQALRTSPEGSFRFVEMAIDLGTADGSDGSIEAWIDDIKVMNYTGLAIKTTANNPNDSWYENEFYRQGGSGTGEINHDRIAFGDARIGAIAAAASTRGTPVNFGGSQVIVVL